MKQTIELTQNLLRRLALMQHLGEDYFIIEDDGTYKAFEGIEDDARKQFEEDIEGTEEADIDCNFMIFCGNNLTEVEELEEDDYTIDYMVLTDEEADEKAGDYIKDSLWAFNPSFLSQQTGLDEEIFQAIADNGKCEDNNDTIYNTIQKLGDIDDFVIDAISTDGRGHFISSYDGNENEETVEGVTFYIYRTN